MTARAFITTWSVVGDSVETPISLHLTESNETRHVELVNYSPSRTGAGLPDKSRMLVIVRSTEIPAIELEQLNDLRGVRLIPSYAFDRPLAEIPSAEGITDKIVAEDIPLSAMTKMQTWGDHLKRVAKYLDADFSHFGNLETTLAKEFE